MKEEIKGNINDPEKLERLYRNDRRSFENDFEEIFPEIKDSELAKFWKIRLESEKSGDKTKSFFSQDLLIMIVSCLFAGFLIKIPAIFGINLQNFHFYEKDAGIIFFLGLTIYTLRTNKVIDKKKLLIVLFAFLVPLIYINLLPSDKNSNSITLAYIHLPILMWCCYGLVFIDFKFQDKNKRIDFIKHNGDLAILGAIILIAGGDRKSVV
jgi:hypothetical protein